MTNPTYTRPWRGRWGRERWRIYTLALGLVVVATMGRMALTSALQGQFPFILYFPVLFVVAWFGGPGPTLLTTGLSVAAAAYFFILPARSLSVGAWPGWVAIAIYAAVGLMLSFMAWHKDWAERRRANMGIELARGEDQLRLITNALPALIAVIDRDERFTFVNSFADRWYGSQDKTLVGKSIADVVGADAYARISPHLRRAFAGETEQFEEQIRYPSGISRWVEATYVPRVEDGRVLGVYIMALDATARRQGEQALRESEERFRQLADAMPQIVWTARPDGSVDYSNRRWKDYLGQSPDPGGITLAAAAHPAEAQALRAAWEAATREETSFDLEARLRSANGGYEWFLLRAVPVRNESGAIVKWFGTCTGIEDQKKAEAKLRAAVESLNRSNKELEDFAYLTSHDLKEPLRGIRSYVSFVIEDTQGKLDTAAVDKLGVIDRLAQRMDRLISSLLYYSQIGRAEFESLPVDLNEAAGRAIEALKPVLAETRARVDVKDRLPMVRCDPVRAAEVFRQLISNAARFNRSPEPLIELGVRETDQADGRPVLFVRDNGIGIDAQHHQSIFRMFRRLHSRDQFGGGIGAGLAIVKKIVDKHGGRIWVEQAPAGGTVFLFTLGSRANADDTSDSDR